MAEQLTKSPKTTQEKSRAQLGFEDLLGTRIFGPAEDPNVYGMILDQMLDSIRPTNLVERLLTRDLIDITWDEIRLRQTKEAVKVYYRGAAVETLLLRENLHDSPVGAEKFARVKTKNEYREWRTNPGKRKQIENRLNESLGGGDVATTAVSYILGQSVIEGLEKSIALAQHRRMVLLREIDDRREFAKRARKASDEALAQSVPKLPPT